MAGYEGIRNKRFNRHYKRALDKTGIPPQDYPLTIKVPLDIAVPFFRRFENHPLVDKMTRREVKPGELIAHLMWAYGNGFAVPDKPNVFEPFFQGLIAERQRRKFQSENTPRKVKNPDEKRGRKPRRQTELPLDLPGGDSNEHMPPGGQ